MKKNNVLVTGGSRGIGAQTAKYLAGQGYHVVVNYRINDAAASTLVQDITAAGGDAIGIKADVSDEAQVIDLFNRIDNELGPITHLVNNAGILLPQMPLREMTAERINKILTTNVTSYFLCAREAIKRMNNYGAIVNVSSRAANTGSPHEYIDYAASKGAIDTFTVGLSKEVAAQGIRVNGVRPGLIYTDMHTDGGEPIRVDRLKQHLPLQRGGKPIEVAQAIAWLLSEQASFVTGSFIDVSGGL